MNYCDLDRIIVRKKNYGEIYVSEWSPLDTKYHEQ